MGIPPVSEGSGSGIEVNRRLTLGRITFARLAFGGRSLYRAAGSTADERQAHDGYERTGAADPRG